MEMRSLTQCLRSRPTTSLYKQPIQLITTRTYANKPSKPFSKTPRTQPTTKTAPPPASDFDEILSKLNINNRDTTAADSSLPSRSQNDPLSLSRAVGMSAETDNYRIPVRRVELKLGPTLGRQVHVEPERGMDLASAFKMLQATVSTNQIKRQSFYQKYHVRRGQLKKNLRMERWRKLFRFSFQKTVGRIEKMRAQGW
ncbi:hypothetical protein BDV29DRAFT_184034 [Aspergillus leporis]|uniref:Ribosomal protein S21 n=1 Tax=Aspergillus leporis TaxID=41062 RepID=A0A5N5WJP8_9EURO|nr:hypothetical protein BDV29DRAFT_184034 [Aspergillus leporis]